MTSEANDREVAAWVTAYDLAVEERDYWRGVSVADAPPEARITVLAWRDASEQHRKEIADTLSALGKDVG